MNKDIDENKEIPSSIGKRKEGINENYSMKDETKISKENKIWEQNYSNASNAKSLEIIELDENENMEQIKYTEEYEKKLKKKIEYYEKKIIKCGKILLKLKKKREKEKNYDENQDKKEGSL